MVCDLSSRSNGDWVEVNDALDRIASATESTRAGLECISIEVHFVSQVLPDGSVMADELSISEMGLTAMAEAGASLEIILDQPDTIPPE